MEAFPATGTHRFSCDLSDPDNGTWTFYYAENEWESESFDEWKNETGDRADYAGEIHHKKTQMVGKEPEAKKCKYTNFKYRQSGGTPTLIGFAEAEIESKDDSEWGAEPIWH